MAQETAMMQADILGTDRERTRRDGSPAFEMPGLGSTECADGHVYMMARGTAGTGFAGVVALMAQAGDDGPARGALRLLHRRAMNRNVLLPPSRTRRTRDEVPTTLGAHRWRRADCFLRALEARGLRARPGAPRADWHGEHARGHRGEPPARGARLVRRPRRPGARPHAALPGPRGASRHARLAAPAGAAARRAHRRGAGRARGPPTTPRIAEEASVHATNGRVPTAARPRRREGPRPHVVRRRPDRDPGAREPRRRRCPRRDREAARRPAGRPAPAGRRNEPQRLAATSTTSTPTSAPSPSTSRPSAATSSASSWCGGPTSS